MLQQYETGREETKDTEPSLSSGRSQCEPEAAKAQQTDVRELSERLRFANETIAMLMSKLDQSAKHALDFETPADNTDDDPFFSIGEKQSHTDLENLENRSD